MSERRNWRWSESPERINGDKHNDNIKRKRKHRSRSRERSHKRHKSRERSRSRKNLLGAVQDENLKGNLDRDPEIRNDNLLFFILYLKNNKLIDNI